MSKPVLGYWNIRGFAHYNRLLLKYVGADFEDKQYAFGPAPDFSRDSWLNEKSNLGLEFPNLPYWIDGDVKITESKAILKYLARTKRPELVPTDALSLAKADMVEGVTHDVLRAVVDATYGRSEIAVMVESVQPKLQQLNDFLNNKDFILGDKLTYVDFFVYEVLHQLQKFKNEVLKAYSNLESYLQRIENLPELAAYVKETESLPSYSPFAKYVY